MFTKYDKAAAAGLASAFTGLLVVFDLVTPEEGAAIGVFLNSLAVFWVPNAE